MAKAEQLDGKEKPRFVVTNLGAGEWPAQRLYEELYCARWEMENRIKEQLSLFADRVSAETMKANQLRLSLAGCAYVLVQALRRLGLKGTEMARAQAATIRERLLKIGARIRISVRRIWLSMVSGYPWQGLFRQAWVQLRCRAEPGCPGKRKRKSDSERSQAELWSKTPPRAAAGASEGTSGPAEGRPRRDRQKPHPTLTSNQTRPPPPSVLLGEV